MTEQDKHYCTIYLVRHGETENNVKDIIQGHIDSPLTKEGTAQVEGLRERLKDIHFDAAFSSDIMRAHRTAEIAALNRKLAINTTQLLRERNFGAYEGRSFEDYKSENQAMIEKLKAVSLKEAHSAKLYDDYESTDEMLGRVFTFLREVAVTYAGKTILAVSHGAMISSLLVHLGYAERGTVWINNAGYVILASDGVDFFVEGTHNVDINGVRVMH